MVQSWRRYAIAVSVLAMSAVSLAACGTSGSSSGSSSTSASGVVSAQDLASFKDSFTANQKVPEYQAPGEPIPNMASLRGSKIMVIPVTSKLLVCEQIGTQLEAFAPQLGMTAKTWDNEGQPSQWASGIQAAIQGHYKAIIFACGVNPQSVTPQLQAAKKAGITVVTSNGGDTSLKTISSLLYGITTSDQIHYQQENVEAAFVKSGGKAHDALIVTSNENVQAPPVVKAIQEKYQSVCGAACNVKVANVAIPDWSTKVQSSVQAALVADPKITAVYCIYAGQAIYAVPALQAAHRSNVAIYTYGGDTGPIESAKSSGLIAVNWSASPAWSAYEAYYQTFRGMAGLPPLAPADADAPYRAITPGNADEYLSASGDGGYGTTFVNGFRKLFGLAPLSGAALIKAAKAGR